MTNPPSFLRSTQISNTTTQQSSYKLDLYLSKKKKKKEYGIVAILGNLKDTVTTMKIDIPRLSRNPVDYNRRFLS